MSDLSSPCIRNCCLGDDDVCLGCFRSMEEIMQWGGADDTSKRQILVRAEERRNARKASFESRSKDGDGAQE